MKVCIPIFLYGVRYILTDTSLIHILEYLIGSGPLVYKLIMKYVHKSQAGSRDELGFRACIVYGVRYILTDTSLIHILEYLTGSGPLVYKLIMKYVHKSQAGSRNELGFRAYIVYGVRYILTDTSLIHILEYLTGSGPLVYKLIMKYVHKSQAGSRNELGLRVSL